MKTWIAVPVLLLLLSGCGKKEEAAAPPPPPAPQQEAPGSAAPATAPEAPAAGAPAPSSSADQAMPGSDKYVVAKGDTLYGIAKKHGLKARDLARWNNIKNPRRLRVGQELQFKAPNH
jgi:LysM repeat protein